MIIICPVYFKVYTPDNKFNVLIKLDKHVIHSTVKIYTKTQSKNSKFIITVLITLAILLRFL